MQAELGASPPASREDVHLLGGLRLAAQALERLHGARLDLAKAMQREDLAQACRDVSLDEAFGGCPLGEA